MAPFLDKISILFGESGVKTLVDDPNQVKLFRTAIINAQDLAGHHSHPIKVMLYFLEEPSKIYFLGEDSSNAGEFWLEAAGGIGRFISNSSVILHCRRKVQLAIEPLLRVAVRGDGRDGAASGWWRRRPDKGGAPGARRHQARW